MAVDVAMEVALSHSGRLTRARIQQEGGHREWPAIDRALRRFYDWGVSTYAWMRILESAPLRYDLGIKILSLGRINAVYERVAQLARGAEVLDLGCGTGNVAWRLAERGLRVTGVDLSPEMLDVARGKTAAGVSVRWVQAGAVELTDHFSPATFDTIVSVLLFSELSVSEQVETLRQCHLILRAGGHLIVADEVRAPTPARRALQNLVRLPLAAVTYALTQTTTGAVQNLEERISAAHFGIVRRESNRLGDFLLVEAAKREARNAARA
jgi:ubiquinone/menaquinone biosynthesis C-methylase UbiE